jgi:carbonic anhydrase/acetyltransferase-like protein (isoleucine patch superfamily)
MEHRFSYGTAPAHRHERGGGWVADTARVEPGAWVGPEATVERSATVSDDVAVRDRARVTDEAQLLDSVVISGDVLVSGRACVYGRARLEDDVWVGDDARVRGRAHLSGRVRVLDRAIVEGDVEIDGRVIISGDGIVRTGDDFLTVGPIGFFEDYITAHRDRVVGIRVRCESFKGSLNEFLDFAEDDRYAEYRVVLDLIRGRFGAQAA